MEKEEKKQKPFLRKVLFVVAPLFILLLGWFGWQMKQIYFPSEPIHYHAGFIVVKDNALVNFSDIKYMHTMPCGDDSRHESTPEEIQIEKAHLHDYIGDVVHVHQEGALWKDLFTNLKYPITYQQTTAYINGKKVPNIENYAISPYDSLVLFVDSASDPEKYLKQAVTKEHIQTTEKKSDNCGT